MATLLYQLNSQNVWTGPFDGVQTVWNFTFAGGYISQSHVKAYYINSAGTKVVITLGPANFLGEFQLSITPAIPATAKEFAIYRDTPKDVPIVNFQDGGTVSEVSLDNQSEQSVFVAAEAADVASLADTAADTAIADALTAKTDAAAAVATANAAQTTANTANTTANTANTNVNNAIATANSAMTTANNAATTANNAATTATNASNSAAASAAEAAALAATLNNPYSANGGPISGNVTIGGTLGVTGIATFNAGTKAEAYDWPATGNLRWRAKRETDGTWQLQRYDSAAVFQDAPINVDDDTGNVTLKSATVTGNATVTGAAALTGGVTLGDAAGDALTINSSAVAIPNGLNFDGGTFVLDAVNNSAGVGSTPRTGEKFAVGGRVVLTGSDAVMVSDSPHLFRIAGGGLGISANNAASGNQPVHVYTSGVERLQIDGAGRYGVNCAPVAATSVISRWQQAGTTDTGIEFQRIGATDNAVVSYNRAGGAYTAMWNDASQHKWAISGIVTLQLDAAGNLGIGDVPRSGSKLDVNGDATLTWATSRFMGMRYQDGSVFDLGMRLEADTRETRVQAKGSDTSKVSFWTGATPTLRAAIDHAGLFTYNGVEIGWRNIPVDARTANYVLTSGDRGTCQRFDIAANIEAPAGLAVGGTFVVANYAAAMTIVQGAGVTLRLAGTSTTGNRTLAQFGVATIFVAATNDYLISGPGVS